MPWKEKLPTGKLSLRLWKGQRTESLKSWDKLLKIKSDQSSRDKSVSLRWDSRLKRASLRLIWEDWEKDLNQRTEKTTDWTNKSKNWPKDCVNCRLPNKKPTTTRLKSAWQQKKLNDWTESWETEITSWATHNPLTVKWKWTSRESQLKLLSWGKRMKLNSVRENNTREKPRNCHEESMISKTRTGRLLSMRMPWPC